MIGNFILRKRQWLQIGEVTDRMIGSESLPKSVVIGYFWSDTSETNQAHASISVCFEKKTHPGSAAAYARVYALCCKLGLVLADPWSMIVGACRRACRRAKMLTNRASFVQERPTNENNGGQIEGCKVGKIDQKIVGGAQCSCRRCSASGGEVGFSQPAYRMVDAGFCQPCPMGIWSSDRAKFQRQSESWQGWS